MSDPLVAIIADALGLPPAAIRVALRPPLVHQSNRLYDVWAAERHLLLKEYLKPEEFRSAPAREFRALELLAPLDIAPRPVLMRERLAPPFGPLVVYEFMEGEMWDRRPAHQEMAALAKVWLRIHAIRDDGLWLSRGQDRPLAVVAAQLESAVLTYSRWVDIAFPAAARTATLCLVALEHGRSAFRELADHRPPLCFCRADARFANVITRPDGRLGLVDWEDSGLRDPARDVADLLTHPNQEDLLEPAAWDAFLQPYLAARERDDPHFAHRLHLYRCLFPVFWLATIIGQGISMAGPSRRAGWHVNGLPANLRLRRYLARALAWPEVDFAPQLAALGGIAFFPTCADGGPFTPGHPSM